MKGLRFEGLGLKVKGSDLKGLSSSGLGFRVQELLLGLWLLGFGSGAWAFRAQGVEIYCCRARVFLALP